MHVLAFDFKTRKIEASEKLERSSEKIAFLGLENDESLILG